MRFCALWFYPVVDKSIYKLPTIAMIPDRAGGSLTLSCVLRFEICRVECSTTLPGPLPSQVPVEFDSILSSA